MKWLFASLTFSFKLSTFSIFYFFSAEEQEKLRRKIGEASPFIVRADKVTKDHFGLDIYLTPFDPSYSQTPCRQANAAWVAFTNSGKASANSYVAFSTCYLARNCFDCRLGGQACPPTSWLAESNLELDKIQQKQSTSLKSPCKGLHHSLQ